MKEIGRYQLLREGGRVKSAGVSMDFVFEQGQAFRDNPGPEIATQITKTFHALRENPPTPIRDRFFPMKRAEIKAITRGTPALYRPVLKTDQGAGKFLAFRTAEVNGSLNRPFQVSLEQGYVIPEAYFLQQLAAKGFPTAIMNELAAVREHFRNGDLYEAKLAFERLQIESEQADVVFRRRSGVGRNALMFIRPARAEKPIEIPNAIVEKVEQRVNASLEELVNRGEEKKKAFAQENGLPYRLVDELSLPLYLQADIHIFPNGDIVIAELQLPDVGLFLCGLEQYGNDVFAHIQEVVRPLKKKVVDGFEKTIRDIQAEKGDVPIYLVTRAEVVGNQEDVLEIRELDEIKRELQERGFEARVISAVQAAGLDSDVLLFLFNLDPNSEEFSSLAKAYLADTRRKLTIVPDPFLRAAEREISNYEHIQMSDRQLDNFLALVGEIEPPNDKKEKVYRQMMAVDHFLQQLGVKEDVLHFCHPTLPTPIPAYRYDLRSLHIASNIMKEDSLKDVQIRSIPISPERGVLLDSDGGILYATFRFMFMRK